MLRFENVGFGFGATRIIDGLNLVIDAGKLVVVLGRSGCGKTTALRLAAGLLQPTRGKVRNGFSATACVFQEPRLMPWASALDNAAFGLKALGVERSERRERAAALLTQFGFDTNDITKRPAELSGGMAQRVSIARALAVEPQLVLMDEPFGALDAGLRREMQDIVRIKVQGGKLAVLFVTHDVPEAVRLADRIIVLDQTPTRVVADIDNTPPGSSAAVYEAAAGLLRHPYVDRALAASAHA